MKEIWTYGEYLVLPNENAPYSLVVACHGSGRCAESYRNVPFYMRQRDMTLENGCAFAACDMGPDTYGTDKGLEILTLFIEKVKKTVHCKSQIAMWGSSAGGSVMFRYAQMYPDAVALLMGTFPVWNLESVKQLASMRKAWHVDDADYDNAALEGANPASHPELLPDVPIVICHGLQDQAVNIDENAFALEKLFPQRVMMFTTQDCHSTQAFRLYDTPILSNSLTRFRERK